MLQIFRSSGRGSNGRPQHGRPGAATSVGLSLSRRATQRLPCAGGNIVLTCANPQPAALLPHDALSTSVGSAHRFENWLPCQRPDGHSLNSCSHLPAARHSPRNLLRSGPTFLPQKHKQSEGQRAKPSFCSAVASERHSRSLPPLSSWSSLLQVIPGCICAKRALQPVACVRDITSRTGWH